MSTVFLNFIIFAFLASGFLVDGDWKWDKTRNTETIFQFDYFSVFSLEFSGRSIAEPRQKMKCAKYS